MSSGNSIEDTSDHTEDTNYVAVPMLRAEVYPFCFRGEWKCGTEYNTNEIVTAVMSEERCLFISLVDFNKAVPSYSKAWGLLFKANYFPCSCDCSNGKDGKDGVGIEFLGQWKSKRYYRKNSIVLNTHQGRYKMYISKCTHQSIFAPNLDTNRWSMFFDSIWVKFKCACINGEDGIDGKDGADGKDGKDGKDGVGFMFRGEWNKSLLYRNNDVVSYLNQLFICVKSGVFTTPPDTFKIGWRYILGPTTHVPISTGRLLKDAQEFAVNRSLDLQLPINCVDKSHSILPMHKKGVTISLPGVYRINLGITFSTSCNRVTTYVGSKVNKTLPCSTHVHRCTEESDELDTINYFFTYTHEGPTDTVFPKLKLGANNVNKKFKLHSDCFFTVEYLAPK